VSSDLHPDLVISGLSIWVHGRQFPDAADDWDGSWLNVTAECSAPGATVQATGNFLRTDEILALQAGCLQLLAGANDPVEVETIEPQLKIRIKQIDRLGHFSLAVNITPDHLTQHHEFRFEIDQSYLQPVITACRQILSVYPTKGSASEPGQA
jgi:hypothetical protein